MTTIITTTPTGRAVRDGHGYGPYHAETAYPNGDTAVACGNFGPHFTEQNHPGGWNGALVMTGLFGPDVVCHDCEKATGTADLFEAIDLVIGYTRREVLREHTEWDASVREQCDDCQQTRMTAMFQLPDANGDPYYTRLCGACLRAAV